MENPSRLKPKQIHFYERTYKHYIEYNDRWTLNRDRMIFYETHTNQHNRLMSFFIDLKANPNADILALRFPHSKFIEQDILIKQLKEGIEVKYEGIQWFPKEIWIYNI